MIAKKRIQELEDALREIRSLQSKALVYIRREGFIFDGYGGPKNAVEWEKLAFSLYTELCTAKQICRNVLNEVL